MSSRARVGIVLAAVVVLVVGFVAAQGGGDDDKKSSNTTAATTQAPVAGAEPQDTTATTDTTPAEPAAPEVETITVVGGKPKGGDVKKLTFTKGDTIRFKVTSDQGGEVHFHGYDIAKEIPEGGGTVTYSVPAKIEGRFEVEMEVTGTQIAEVEVDPS